MHRMAIADSFHLHERNFPSLFKYMASKKISPHVLLHEGTEGYGLIQATGDYSNLEAKVDKLLARYLEKQAELLAIQTADELYETEVAYMRLWPLCRSEMLAYLLTLDNWQVGLMGKNDRAIFDKAWTENRNALTLNLSAASYWLNYWFDNRMKIFQNHYCCVFSGSMTYTRTLIELLRRSPTRVMMMESTFTGNDYIFEEMYHPVANNLGVMHRTLRESRRLPDFEAPNQYDREVIKARNKILSAANKNVAQPPERSLPLFAEEKDQILIVGQVVNDFSLIEDGFPYVGSIPVYIEMLSKLLAETDCNIVFKAHPWEHKKVNLKAPKTFEALAAFIATLPDETRARVLLVEDVNLHGLINASKYFVTFCSQAGIEAALLGFKPFVLGRAFYSGCGFTEDCDDIDTLVAAVRDSNGFLDLESYKCFDRFIVDMFQYGTISIYDSGVKRIESMLQRPSPLEQKSPLKTELELGNTVYRNRSEPSHWSGVLRKKLPLPNDPEKIRSITPQIGVNFVDMPTMLSSAAETIELRLSITNNSEFVLPSRVGSKSFQMSYHIFAEDGSRYVWNGEMTGLKQEIHSDARLEMKFKVPSEPGIFKVVPALLCPGICWFDSDKAWEITVA